jgi:hypothetical protein
MQYEPLRVNAGEMLNRHGRKKAQGMRMNGQQYISASSANTPEK